MEAKWLLGFLFTLVVTPFFVETAQALQHSVAWGFWDDLGGGQDKILHVLSLLFPGHLQNSHRVPLLNAVWALQELAMWKNVIILCPHGRRSTGELESTAGWGQQQFIGLENYVGFTFYTPVNSDFHEVGGVATATVVSHHFCCLCHRDHLILS